MRNLTTAVVAGLGALVLTSPSLAEVSIDLSAGWSRLTASEGPVDIDLDAVAVRGTLHLNDYFGAELEGQVGVGDDSIGAVDIELDNAWGIFARGDLPLGQEGGLFGRVGYFDQSVDASSGPLSASFSEDGWAAGVGGEYFFWGPSGVRAEYTRYEYDDGDADGFALSYVFAFGRR